VLYLDDATTVITRVARPVLLCSGNGRPLRAVLGCVFGRCVFDGWVVGCCVVGCCVVGCCVGVGFAVTVACGGDVVACSVSVGVGLALDGRLEATTAGAGSVGEDAGVLA
jgi:hypothetical protein